MALAALLAVLALAACGGGGDSGEATGGGEEAGRGEAAAGSPAGVGKGAAGSAGKEEGSGSEGATGYSGPDASEFAPKTHEDSGGGSAQFRVEGGDNSVQEFGAEAGEAEFEQAAAALHGFLDAAAQGNYAAACRYISREAVASFAALAGGGGCAASLEALLAAPSAASRREAAAADVGSLRVEGARGFLVYRGAGGAVYAISVSREDGEWKLAALAGVPLN